MTHSIKSKTKNSVFPSENAPRHTINILEKKYDNITIMHNIRKQINKAYYLEKRQKRKI